MPREACSSRRLEVNLQALCVPRWSYKPFLVPRHCLARLTRCTWQPHKKSQLYRPVKQETSRLLKAGAEQLVVMAGLPHDKELIGNAASFYHLVLRQWLTRACYELLLSTKQYRGRAEYISHGPLAASCGLTSTSVRADLEEWKSLGAFLTRNLGFPVEGELTDAQRCLTGPDPCVETLTLFCSLATQGYS